MSSAAARAAVRRAMWPRPRRSWKSSANPPPLPSRMSPGISPAASVPLWLLWKEKKSPRADPAGEAGTGLPGKRNPSSPGPGPRASPEMNPGPGRKPGSMVGNLPGRPRPVRAGIAGDGGEAAENPRRAVPPGTREEPQTLFPVKPTGGPFSGPPVFRISVLSGPLRRSTCPRMPAGPPGSTAAWTPPRRSPPGRSGRAASAGLPPHRHRQTCGPENNPPR